MSAGTGVTHSEFNPSKSEAVHLLQIWILPEAPGIKPSYEQRKINREELKGKLKLLAAREPEGDAVLIHQDVKLYAAKLDGGVVKHDLKPGRYAWIQVARGSMTLNGTKLEAGDGAAVSNEKQVTLAGNGEALLFDLN